MSRLVRTPLAAAMIARESGALRPRPLSAYDAAALGIDTRSSQATKSLTSGIKGRALTGEVNAPAYEVVGLFPFQSYFDSGLLETAILPQPPNQPIVPSTLSKPIMTAGYGLALTPSSQTPVAVQFFTGGQQGRSATYRLKPGEVIYPYGRPDGIGNNGQFSGFQWGLPFGWLGGGSATLITLRTADAEVNWANDENELIYHRMRLQIVDAAALPVLAGAYSGPINWPQRFPWPAAVSGVNSLTQRGRPAIAVFPTRTALSLRLATVAGSTMRMYFVGTNDFDTLSTGVADLTGVRATDIAWGTWAQQAGAVAPFNSTFEMQFLTGEAERLAADAGAVALAAPVGNELINSFVDVVRYGKI